MKSFTDTPSGDDKFVIVRNFVEPFFGIIPIGDVRKCGSGGAEYGPATRFAINSERILSRRGTGN